MGCMRRRPPFGGWSSTIACMAGEPRRIQRRLPSSLYRAAGCLQLISTVRAAPREEGSAEAEDCGRGGGRSEGEGGSEDVRGRNEAGERGERRSTVDVRQGCCCEWNSLSRTGRRVQAVELSGLLPAGGTGFGRGGSCREEEEGLDHFSTSVLGALQLGSWHCGFGSKERPFAREGGRASERASERTRGKEGGSSGNLAGARRREHRHHSPQAREV
eukprot:3376741-Rhodomonas_salina.2